MCKPKMPKQPKQVTPGAPPPPPEMSAAAAQGAPSIEGAGFLENMLNRNNKLRLKAGNLNRG